MGALHQGHIHLVKQARHESDLVVVSIFVNPIQFNNPSDLAQYPRTLSADLKLLEDAGVDLVFVPENSEMYPSEVQVAFRFGALEEVLEGAFRPGHFNGVAIVVSKLFHIIQPDLAYFGQKDLQQVSVIRRLVKDLQFDLQVRVVPTVRETDGLALSSRNLRLSPEQRLQALSLYKCLESAKSELLKGNAWFDTKKQLEGGFDHSKELRLEYLELVDLDDFRPAEKRKPELKQGICIAAYVGEVRLIDNIILD